LEADVKPSIAAFATLVLVILGVPRAGEAGILDFIWEMSGPQMLGYSHGCLYSFTAKKWVECRAGQVPIVLNTVKGKQENAKPTQERTSEPPTQDHGLMWGFNAAILTSTARDSRTQSYRWFEITMVEVGTGVAFESYRCTCSPDPKSEPEVRVRHGVGVFYEGFLGQRTKDNNGAIDGFHNWGVSVTPVDVTLKRVAVGVKLRLYPHGFSDDQFKAGLPVTSDRPFETTLGFTFSLILPKKG
jgi:hypothetical protein